MTSSLRVTLRFLTGRYHGAVGRKLDRHDAPWPPSPARLFQALAAGAARGSVLDQNSLAALNWLEGLAPPVIAAPHATTGQTVSLFVPNNDLDAVGGDSARLAEIRVPKPIRPYLFDASVPLHFFWPLVRSDDQEQAIRVCNMAERLYQLGRGIDPAFADAGIEEAIDTQARLDSYAGVVYRAASGGALRLACPGRGSLRSLQDRFAGGRRRFATACGQTTVTPFTRPPRAWFENVAYSSPPRRVLYELRNTDGGFFAWPQERAHNLVMRVRDLLCERLPKHAAVLKGAKGDDEAAKARRARFIPLPSVGMEHADRSIRRLLIELPSDCPLRIEEIGAKLSGASFDEIDPETGKVRKDGPVLVETDSDQNTMLRHYGVEVGHGYRRWRSVTPLALPVKRRRIDPDRQCEDAKGGVERLAETAAAITAAKAALRHAGRARAQIVAARPQKEPFAGKGRRAEDFKRPERFSKHQMWHLDLTLREPVTGPLILGDGRFAGLGLMAPVREPSAILAFAIDEPPGELAGLCRALRRAVMHKVADHLGARSTHDLDAFFTGHEREGAPLRQGDHRHLFFAMDDIRLLIIAPHRVEHRAAWACERERLGELDAALIGLDHLRIGRRTLRLTPLPEPGDDDLLLRPARRWESRTAYTPTRHPKRGGDARAHLAHDIRAEASRRGLARPDKVEILSLEKGPRGGLTARIALDFAVAIPGPILLGRTAHRGGGLFGGNPGNKKGGD